MAKKKLKDFFKYYSSPYAFLSLFKDDKAHIKKVVLAFLDEVERLPFPIDWSKGKDDASYWHSVYDVVLKHYESQLTNQLNQSINQSIPNPKTLKVGGIMRKLFNLAVVSGLSLLAFSGFAYADILQDAMNAVNSLVAGIQGLLSAVASILIFFLTYKVIKKALNRA